MKYDEGDLGLVIGAGLSMGTMSIVHLITTPHFHNYVFGVVGGIVLLIYAFFIKRNITNE